MGELLKRLRALPHTRMGMMDAHLMQGATLRFIELQAGHDSLVVDSL
jgi:hypothetical protein